MVHCSNCGGTIGTEDAFCPHCGTAVGGAERGRDGKQTGPRRAVEGETTTETRSGVTRRRLLAYGGTAAAVVVGWYVLDNDSSSSRDWPQFQFDARNSGHSSAAGPVNGVQPRWEPFAAGSPVGSPVVANGTVYVGDQDGHVYAVDAATGRERWQVDTGGSVTEAPAVVDSSVYVGTDDEQVYALDAANGTTVWQATLSAGKSGHFGITVSDGRVFVGDADRAFALDTADGTEHWQINTGECFGGGTSPATRSRSPRRSKPSTTRCGRSPTATSGTSTAAPRRCTSPRSISPCSTTRTTTSGS